MYESARNHDGSLTVYLQHPFEHAGEKVPTLTIKARPTVADLKRMDGASGDVGKTCQLIASLCEVPTSLVENLHAADYVTVNEAVNDILGKPNPQETSETSLEI